MDMCGLVVDAPRLVEPLSHYRRVIDFCHDWGFNTLLFRLTDDQGSALRFASHPELITHPDALDPEDARALVEYAIQRGVDLIPEIESFGHTRYIIDTPQHRALSDASSSSEGEFSGLTPLHPSSMELMADLYREVCEIFPSAYLHGGCDEVNWGGSAFSRTLLQTQSRDQVWAAWINYLAGLAHSLGRQFIIWGDHVLRGNGQILSRLDQRIIIHDWHYSTRNADTVRRYAQRVIDAGLRVIGGPALGWSRWGARPNVSQLDNIDAFVNAYRSIDEPQSLGIILTHWVPTRYLQNAWWDALAYAAIAMNEGSGVARQEAFERFVTRHFGAPWNEDWATVFRDAYDLPRPIVGRGGEEFDRFLPTAWGSDEELLASTDEAAIDVSEYTELQARLSRCATTVRRNWGDLAAFRLTFEYLEHLHWRRQLVLEAAADQRPELITTVAERDQHMLAALEDDWDRGRNPVSPAKNRLLTCLRKSDQLLYAFRQAADYSRQLSREPRRTQRLLEELREKLNH